MNHTYIRTTAGPEWPDLVEDAALHICEASGAASCVAIAGAVAAVAVAGVAIVMVVWKKSQKKKGGGEQRKNRA